MDRMMREKRGSITSKQSSVLFFRHSPVIEKGLCYGQSDHETEHSALEVAHLFSRTELLTLNESDLSYDHIQLWSSPAVRCAEPARMISLQQHWTLMIDPRLYELSFGKWEGLTWEEIERRDKIAFHQWMAHWKTKSPPQGECLEELSQRVGEWYKQLPSNTLHILIGHAGVWRALLVLSKQLSWDEAMSVEVPHLTLSRLH